MPSSLRLLCYLIIFAALSQIALLAWHRGGACAGYELLAPAVGLSAIVERGLFGAILDLSSRSFDFGWWNPTHGIVFTLPAGLLTLFSPSLWWVHYVSAGIWFITLLLYAKSTQQPFVLLLAVMLTSPAILTHLLVGYPYLSGVVPFLLAIAWIESETRFSMRTARSRFCADLVIAIALHLICLQTYEMGKAWGLVYVCAALAIPDLKRNERGWLFILGFLSAIQIAIFGRNNIDYVFADFGSEILNIAGAGAKTTRQVFFSLEADSPCLVWMALLSLLFPGRRKAYMALLFFSQFGLLVLGNMQTDTLLFPENVLIPRRVLVLQTMAALMASRWILQRANSKASSVGLVVAASVTVGTTCSFLLLAPAGQVLPYLTSPIDYRVDRALISDANLLFQRIGSTPGRHYIAYELDSGQENMGDPQGLPERLLLTLPSTSVYRRVTFLSYRSCRFWCMPDWFVAPPDILWHLPEADASPAYLHVFRYHPESPIVREIRREKLLVIQSRTKFFTSYLIRDRKSRKEKGAAHSSADLSSHKGRACLQVYRPLGYPQIMSDWRTLDPKAEKLGLNLPASIRIPGSLSTVVTSVLVNRSKFDKVLNLTINHRDELIVVLDRRLVFSTGPGERAQHERMVTLNLSPGSHRLRIVATSIYAAVIGLELRGEIEAVCPVSREFDEAMFEAQIDPAPMEASVCIASAAHEFEQGLPLLITAKRPGRWIITGEMDAGAGKLVLFDVVHDDAIMAQASGRKRLGSGAQHRPARKRSSSAFLSGRSEFRFVYENLRDRGVFRLQVVDVWGEPLPVRCVMRGGEPNR